MARQINVTAEHIAHATRNSSYHCAVAEAVAAQVTDARHVLVDIQTIRYSQGDYRYVYMTPQRVIEHIIAFDAGEKLEPFSFRLQHHIWSGRRIYRPTSGDYTIGQNEASDEKIDEAAELIGGSAYITTSGTTSDGRRIGITRRVRAPAPPALAIRRGTRVYGVRMLRVNQEEKGN